MILSKLFKKKSKKEMSWSDITLEKFHQIQDILACVDEYTEANLVEAIYGVDTSNMSITELKQYGLSFMQSPIKNENIKLEEKYILNGRRYNSNINLTVIRTSQFNDFTNYAKEDSNNYEKLLSVFIIPEGHNYNDGYNMREVQDDIRKLPITVVMSMAFFMTKQLQMFAIIFQSYLAEETKKMNIPTEEKKKMLEEIDKTISLAYSLF